MKKYCQSIAKSTGQPCKKKAIPGSRYCLIHIEHLPLIYAALLGALISLIFNESYKSVIPSKELIVVDSLNNQISIYQNLINSNEKASKIQSERYIAQLDSLNRRIKPFVEIAKSNYPNYSTKKALELLQSDILRIREATAPLTISYNGFMKTKSENDKGITVDIFFRKSKPGPILRIEFYFNIISPESAKILDITTSYRNAYSNSIIYTDRKYGGIAFDYVKEGILPSVELTVSEPAHIEITGNNGFKNKILDIK